MPSSSSDPPVSDYAGRGAPPTSSPPAVKVSREIGTTVRDVAAIGAITAGLLSSKLDATLFIVTLIVVVLRGKHGVGEQTLVELMKGRLS